MKKCVAILTTAAMCMTLLAGCGNSGSNPSTPSDDQTPQTQGGASEGPEGSDSSGLINFDEEPYEVVIENLTLGADMADLEMVENAINEITLPAINCTVKILNLHITDHVTRLSLMAAGNEKIDIVTTGRTYSFPSMVSDGLLLPLDDLLAERGHGIMEKAERALQGGKVGDSVYSVPGSIYAFESAGLIYNKDMADEYGITVPEMPTWDDIEAIAAQLKEVNPDMYLLTRGTGEQDMVFSMYQPNVLSYGVNAIYGAMDKNDSDLKIFNLFKSDDYREYLHKNREWYEKGWVPSDSMVSGVNPRDIFLTEQCFCEPGTTSPLQLGVLQPSYDFELGMEPMVVPEVNTAGVQENGWGISINSERPDKAMDFLNLMYTNEDVINLLMNGIEGVHYEKVSDRIIRYPEGVNAGNVGYSRIFSVFGDSLMAYQWEPVTEEAIDECYKINETAEINPTYGFSFDTAPVATQVSNVTNVIAEYMPALVVGIYDDDQIDEQLDKMNAALDAAGMEDIIAEHQRQLDEWKASK